MLGKKNAKSKQKVRPKEFQHTEDTKYIDLLDEDKPLAGQKYACLSFVSPEDIIKIRIYFSLKNILNISILKSRLINIHNL